MLSGHCLASEMGVKVLLGLEVSSYGWEWHRKPLWFRDRGIGCSAGGQQEGRALQRKEK